VSLARYVVAFGMDIPRAVNPANAIVGSATRTWSDANLNYVPDCDLTTTAAAPGRREHRADGYR